MTQFLGTHFGKLDRKGRISIPAPFRAELEAAATNQLVFRISHTHPCIEVRSRVVFQQMLDAIRSLDHFSEQRDALEAGIVADSLMLKIDGEGRLVLPEDMFGEIGLAEPIAFLGKGDRFEIWDAAAARAHVAEAKQKVRDQRLTIAAAPLPGSASPLHATPRGMT